MSYLSSIESPAHQVSQVREFSPLPVVSRKARQSQLLDKLITGHFSSADAVELMNISAPSANDVLAELKTESRQQRPFRVNPHD